METVATVAAAAYLLVTVSGFGEVRSSPQPDLRACLEARSVALYGVTVEEDARQVAAAEAEARARLAAWDATHPFREAATPFEREVVAAFAGGGLSYDSRYEFQAPNLVRDRLDATSTHAGSTEPGSWVDVHAGRWVDHGGHDARTAVCAPREGTVGAP